MRRNIQRWRRNIGGNIGGRGASPNRADLMHESSRQCSEQTMGNNSRQIISIFSCHPCCPMPGHSHMCAYSYCKTKSHHCIPMQSIFLLSHSYGCTWGRRQHLDKISDNCEGGCQDQHCSLKHQWTRFISAAAVIDLANSVRATADDLVEI